MCVVWLVAWLSTTLGANAPSPLILGGIVVTIFMALWLWTDTFRVTDSSSWAPPSPSFVGQRGVDHRVQRLTGLLASGRYQANVAAEVHSSLVKIVDELLETRHGVQRAADPVAARAILGDQLWGYVSRPARQRLTGYRTYLAELLTEIEAL
ncbi:MAG: hypothetical protein ACR2KG_08015 [Nocardioidaceae bacterium]